jgi:hypothetical protein
VPTSVRKTRQQFKRIVRYSKCFLPAGKKYSIASQNHSKLAVDQIFEMRKGQAVNQYHTKQKIDK